MARFAPTSQEGVAVASLHHVSQGSGSPPIVFVHGFGCSHTDWQAQVAHFSSRHTVIAVDLPGHGATQASATPASLEHCAAELAEFLRARALPPAVLVGHSMGCRVVLEAAELVPKHVAAVVLLDGSQFAAAMADALAARFAAGEYKALVRGMFEPMFTLRSDAVVKAAVIERALAMSEPVGQALLLGLVRYDVDKLASVLEKLPVPLLILQTTYVDENRQRVPIKVGQTTPYLDFVRAKVPHARIEILPDLGHFPQLDAPAETNAILASFIASLRRSP